ncbi:unnamed protein product [Clavelina lepadiformis]|uniref:Enhancer of mRNA-decapping protein 4 n=1 Tax=Clavelina lepadiformis TaxID=159417 RepID=A0ABP0GVD8_CLALP
MVRRNNHSVRVINRQNSSDRVLLKGFTSEISDVAFSHSTSTMLAAVDFSGNLIIWSMIQMADSMSAEKRFHLVPSEGTTQCTHRVIWVPHVQTDESIDDTKSESQDSPKYLVLAYSNIAEVWDLDIAFSVSDGLLDGKLDRPHVSQCFLSIKQHDDEITDCELSPIGNVVATASYDGYVKFWQVQIDDTEAPSCLHQWKPHDGRPVSAVKFCDNRKHPEQSIFWRFLLTGSDRNNELKMWCTVTWNCLQVVKFEPPSPADALPELKIIFDLSAEFLVLADIHRKVLYVMQCDSNINEGTSQLSSIAKFQLAAPILSMAFSDARYCKFKSLLAEESHVSRSHHGSELESDEDEDEEDKEDKIEAKDQEDDGEKMDGILIKLITVQARGLQSLEVRFVPNDSNQTDANCTSTYNTISEDIKDQVSLSSVDDPLSPPRDKASDGDPVFLVGMGEEDATSETPELVSVGSDDQGNKSDNDLPPLEDSTEPNNDQTLIAVTSPGESPEDEEAPTAPDVTQPASTPVLLTPDAFMGSHKSPGNINESASSSFTNVTPFSQMGSSFYQPNQENLILGGVKNSLPNIMMSSSGAEDEEEPNPTQTPPSSPLQPQATSSPTPPPQAPAVAAAEILQSICSRSVKSPDLISSTSTLDEVKPDISPAHPTPGAGARSHAEGPISMIPSSASADGYPPIIMTSSSSMPSTSMWPKAPDVTMSRPIAVRASPDPPQEPMGPLDRGEPSDWGSRSVPPSAAQPVEPAVVEAESVIKLINDYHEQQIALLNRQQLELEAIATQQHNMQQQNDVTLKRFEQQNDRLEKAVKSLSDNQRRLSTDMKSMQSGVTEVTAGKIDRVIKNEIKKTLLPGLTQAMQPIKEELNTTVALKLAATDAVLKEHIGKVVESKNVAETFAAMTSKAIEGHVQASLKEVFLTRVVPSFEQSCQVMFQQLAGTFHRGLEEAFGKLEKQIQLRLKPDQDRLQGLVKEAYDATNQLQLVSKNIQSEMVITMQKQISENIEKTFSRCEGKLTASLTQAIKQHNSSTHDDQKRVISDIVRDVVGKTIEEKLSRLSEAETSALSGARVVAGQINATPMLHRPSLLEQQQQILKLLQQGNVNTAFQTALTAADLNLVMYVCETVDPSVVFGVSPCPLQQPILLSLIQQLSSDLASKTEIKLKYLQEAVMNLDRRHQITQEYMHSVLSALVQKLLACAQGPLENPSLGKDLKMLAMAAQSLMK